jgi:hypothetical protein
VPAAIEGDFTRHRFDLTEHFRRLRRSAGAGPDGCRNEYRTALTAQFDDPEAAQVMRRFDQFATLLANVDLPRWFYVAWSVSRICPLRKTTRVSRARPRAPSKPLHFADRLRAANGEYSTIFPPCNQSLRSQYSMSRSPRALLGALTSSLTVLEIQVRP